MVGDTLPRRQPVARDVLSKQGTDPSATRLAPYRENCAMLTHLHIKNFSLERHWPHSPCSINGDIGATVLAKQFIYCWHCSRRQDQQTASGC